MQVLVRTDSNLSAGDLQSYVESAVTGAVGRFGQQVTRVEAHVGDDNSRTKSGAKDIRCTLEARIAGAKPVAVTHQAENVRLAVDGAADKLQKALDSTLGKLEDRRRQGVGTGKLAADLAQDEEGSEPEEGPELDDEEGEPDERE
ncbi:MAG TPA: HPF/RaiA family ribosome-associated protein [Thermomicrobiales bacterium]|jgi:ribosome-associated translation inhibitor RaiA|nr:HPF/RaiA family ribosome-associated protein [Thermomicrobiales bacterium]